MMKLPKNDTFVDYCAIKGYPTEYNDGLIKALQTDLVSSLEVLNDLLRLYYQTNGSTYLYP